MAATYSSLIGIAVGGKYEIRRVLGAGGMGVVCEAVHLDLGKKVAVKLIDKTMKESELIVTRFRREARAAGQIASEHIVDVFDVGADARVGLYMVMELLKGEDLQTRLERDKRLDVKVGVMIAHQMARGLAKAHEAGIIHRDLKPANVFLTERDSGQLLVKLLDFGVSKLLADAPGDARITGSGAPIGTPLYMAPEQAEGRDDVDQRADVWSLGAVLYEVFAGTPPFADKGSYHGTILGILSARPRLLADAAPWLPPQVAAVVDAMLVHDRDARLPSALMVTQRLLDAFPTVLPDGTGKYTAVIVPHAAGSIDATGDTEVFTAASFAAARARAGTVQPTDGGTRRPSTPPPRSQPPPPPGPDVRTLAEGADGRASESLQTGAATNVDVARYGLRAQAFATPMPTSSGRPKTEPIPPSTPLPPLQRSPLSSGASPPLSVPPASAEPLPPSLRASLDERAPRRGGNSRLLILLFVVVAVAVGGYLFGQRASPRLPAPVQPPGAASISVPPAPASHEPLVSTAPLVAVPPPTSTPLSPASAQSSAALSSAPSVTASAVTAPRTKRKPKPPARVPEAADDPPPTTD